MSKRQQPRVQEIQKTASIHQALVAKHLSPGEHIVDSAYIDAEALVDSRQKHGISLIGPARPNSSWQSRVAGAYDVDQFQIDWVQQRVRCPQGKVTSAWNEGVDQTGSPLVFVTFRRKDCKRCPVKEHCTRAVNRRLAFRPRKQYEALQQTRTFHASDEGKRLYNRRAGIEGTISQGVRRVPPGRGLRCCRYRRLAKTALQHIATATAINLDRIVAWLNEIPQAKTPVSRFARLAPT